jgi:hypothetical protein
MCRLRLLEVVVLRVIVVDGFPVEAPTNGGFFSGGGQF